MDAVPKYCARFVTLELSSERALRTGCKVGSSWVVAIVHQWKLMHFKQYVSVSHAMSDT